MRKMTTRITLALVGLVLGLSSASAQQQQPPQRQTAPPARSGAPRAGGPAASNPLVTSTKAGYEGFKGFLVKAAAQVTESDYGFKPAGVVPEVRTFGQIIGHVADANLALCSAASGTQAPAIKDAEHMKTKAEITKALGDAFAFCDKAWAATTDANAATPVELPFGLGKSTRLAALAFNSGHNGEHYGNIVTYMRAKGLVPPSSAK